MSTDNAQISGAGQPIVRCGDVTPMTPDDPDDDPMIVANGPSVFLAFGFVSLPDHVSLPQVATWIVAGSAPPTCPASMAANASTEAIRRINLLMLVSGLWL